MTHWRLSDESPRARADRIQQFVAAYGTSDFRHVHEIVPLLRRDDPVETRIVAHAITINADFRSTYQVRAAYARSRTPPPNYPPDLAGDLQAFSLQLDAARDQPAVFWRIGLLSRIVYAWTELLDEQRIAGAVKTASRRVADPDAFRDDF